MKFDIPSIYVENVLITVEFYKKAFGFKFGVLNKEGKRWQI